MSNLPTNQGTAIRNLFNGTFYQAVNVSQETYDMIYLYFLDKTNLKESAAALTDAVIAVGKNNNLNPANIIQEFDKATNVSDLKKVLVAILNSSRYSTSKIGFKNPQTTNRWVDRNIIA